MNTPIGWKDAFGGLDGLRYALKQNAAWMIRFKKVNGEIREMVSTLYAPYINKHSIPTTPKPVKVSADPFAEADKAKRQAELLQTNLSVFDVDKKAWRSMKVENILEVNPVNIKLD